MKPRRLKIKGLNSFIEEQEVDFETLTEKGLFGIFGPTGSGKSSILDAMTLALYGAISRDTREYMNTLSNSLAVSYEFEIGNGSLRKVYIADRVVNKDKNGAYKLKSSRLREISEGADTPIAEGSNEVKAAVEKIIGLTADDFTRSVVLPQGKFNEFLRLTGKERRNMLERIFRLEKFGRKLGDKIRAKKKDQNDSLIHLLGRINNYADRGIDEASYKALKEEYKISEAMEQSLKAEKVRLTEDYDKYKIVWELQQELEVYKQRVLKEEALKEAIEEKQQSFIKGKKAAMLKPYIDGLEETINKLEASAKDIKNLGLSLAEIEKKLINTEKLYKEWQEKKDKELPSLIQKETKLNRALEIIEKISVLEKEREKLVEEYKAKAKDFNKLKDDLNNVIKAKEGLQLQKLEVEKRLEETTISPEFREELMKANSKEDDNNKLVKDIKDFKAKAEEKVRIIKSLEEKLSKLQGAQDLCFKEIALTEEKIETLHKENPGDSSILMDIKEKLHKLELELKEKEDSNKIKAEREENLKKLCIEKEEKLKAIKETTEFLIISKEKAQQLENGIKKIEKENMAAMLAVTLEEGELCPVCGATHHPHKAESIDDSELSLMREEKQHLEKDITEAEKNISQQEIALNYILKNEEELVKELKLLEEKLKGNSLEGLKEESAALNNKFSTISLKIEKWNKDKDAIEKSLNLKKDEKNNFEKDNIRLSEAYKNEKNTLKDLEESINKFLQKSSLLEEELSSIKEKLKVQDIKAEIENLNKLHRENVSLQKKQKDISKALEDSEKRKEEITALINDIHVAIGRIEESGKEKKAVIEREKQELSLLTEGKDAKQYLAEVKKQMQEIVNNEENYKVMLDKEKQQLQVLNEKLYAEKNQEGKLSEAKLKQEHKLNSLIEENGFASLEAAKQSLISQETMDAIEKEIREYEDKVKDTAANIKRISSRLKDDFIDEENWLKLQREKEEINIKLETEMKELATKKQSLSEIKKGLQELKELNVKKQELEHLCSNLEDISKLVEGNKFVEFVATNQLKYISMEASKRLKAITRGRYALEIDASGNFIMRDDFNGGIRRATSTLSGGETFLTSLCLALALSSQIQLKGSAPLEFFFLDEGFGTLDSELLETVMCSLERLRSDKLCVGIISHVEELKSRVPVKLIVDPAEHGKCGSRVRIELS